MLLPQIQTELFRRMQERPAKMKTIMRIFAAFALFTGSVTTWHAVMPASACWLNKEELLGCILLAALTTIASTGIAIMLEEENRK